MGNSRPHNTGSPFYDHAFAARKHKKGRLVPINTRTIEQWICDRCGTKAEFPDETGQMPFEKGWLKLNLQRSLTAGTMLREKNEQILCPKCVLALALWFKDKTAVDR